MALDWRIQAAVVTASDTPATSPGGPSHPAGSTLILTSIAPSPEGIQYAFPTPSTTALALNIAASAVRIATRLKSDLKFSGIPGPPAPAQHRIVMQPELAFDYFEQCFIALMFSIQALEAYCNYKVAYMLNKDFPIERRNKPVLLSPTEVQRNLSLDEKLGEVLPRLLNLATPKGGSVWKNYIDIRRLRDDIVHIKSHHQWTSFPGDFQKSPYTWCVHQPPSSILLPGIEMLQYFASDHELKWLDGARKAMNECDNSDE